LRDILGVRGISENAARNTDRGRQVTSRKQLECPLVAARDPGHKRFVAVIHRGVMVAMPDARPL
jgi:hypothetical protein